MKLDDVIQTLKKEEKSLRPRGVIHAAVFGSLARGEENADSDIDILLDIDPDARVTVYDYVSLKEDIAALFDRRVDVVDRQGLKPRIRESVDRDIIYAF